ncbi:MAG: hypothetical protein R2874_16820 [Desulfobacterales bacterium]
MRSDPDSGVFEFVLETSKKARENLVGELYSQEPLDRTLSSLEIYRKAHPNSKQKSGLG